MGFRQPSAPVGKKSLVGAVAGPLYQYASNPDVIHCPGDFRATLPVNGNADNSTGGFGFAWASYSGVEFINGQGSGPLLITKATQIRHTSDRILWVEECDSRGDNEGSWEMNNPSGDNVTWVFYDSPASYHGTSSTFNFADGHAESRKWLSGAVVAYAASMDPNKYSDTLVQNADTQGLADEAWLSADFATTLNP
jgi:prepilin-type processing-associated H-X9-DG protein